MVQPLPGKQWCKKGLDYLYHRTRYVLSHPCCALWFTFWDDVQRLPEARGKMLQLTNLFGASINSILALSVPIQIL